MMNSPSAMRLDQKYYFVHDLITQNLPHYNTNFERIPENKTKNLAIL